MEDLIVVFLIIYWTLPFVFLGNYFYLRKKRPKDAKEYAIAAIVMLLIGFGFCGSVFYLLANNY